LCCYCAGVTSGRKMRILPVPLPAGRIINGDTMKTPRHRSHDEATINSFRKDPQFAAEYLNAILEDGDQQELLTALRYLAAAFGGVPYLAEQAELNATTLYRTLSPRGNPELKSLLALLKALGLRLAVQPLKPTSVP